MFYAAVFALVLAVDGDAGVVPRAPAQSSEFSWSKEKRKSTRNIGNNVNNLTKSGMDRKTLIILLSVTLGIIIISCATLAIILYKRHKDASEEVEEHRRQRRQQPRREKEKKKEKKRQAEPRPSEDDDEERTLVDSGRPSMQVDMPFGSSTHQQGENQFATYSTRSSYVSDRRVEPVQEEAAPFLNNAGPQRSTA
ncbi:hypothetical protein FRC01_013848 [Tulasnella sp. 417]|nr:hypothetical protein FRC01_013848 [Tulasnella sp. 417]